MCDGVSATSNIAFTNDGFTGIVRSVVIKGHVITARVAVPAGRRNLLWGGSAVLKHTAVVVAMLFAASAWAHHSYSEFDDQQTVEIEGELTKASWINPHAVLTVRAKDTSGKAVTWEIETTPVNFLRRWGVPLEIYALGSTVKVAGWPSKRTSTRMYGTNLLSADGRETVLWRAAPRWKSSAYGTESPPAVAGLSSATTLFRAWGSAYARPGIPDDDDAAPIALYRIQPKLTPAAQAARATFAAADATTAPGCTPKGMPGVMAAPGPIEIVDRGATILFRQEEYDTVRTFHMNADPSTAATQPETPLGYSVAHWDDDALVVETSRVREEYLNPRAVPLGRNARFVERFRLATDGSRLLYTMVLTDPEMLAEPLEQKRSWIPVPNDQLLPFNCVEEGASAR